ncbi:MAG: DUF5667 domain-containing protein, partial [Nitriliruptorales bacterium]
VPPEVRDRHLALIRSRLTDAQAPVATAGPIRRRLTALAAGLATFLTLGGGGAVALAQNAQPGDPLYGLKRATERVRLAFAGDQEEDSLHVTLAERRIQEAAGAPDQRHELLTQALDALLAASEAPGERAVTVLASLLETDLPDDAAEQATIALAVACERIAARTSDVPDACRVDDSAVTTDTETPTDGYEEPGPRASPADDRRPDHGEGPGDGRERETPGSPESPGARGGDRPGGPDR